MVSTLQPRQYFPISRLLPDPFDTATYYVRAVIRNATTNVTIATVDLASIGNRIYSTPWQAVADPSGQGLFITITSEVYTDAAYTVKSDVYGQEQDTFLIYEREKNVASLATQISALISTGEHQDVNYKKIRDIFQEELAKQTKVLQEGISSLEKEEKEIDFSSVHESISNTSKLLLKAITEFKQAFDGKKDKEVDFSSILNEISNVRQAITQLDIPEFKETNLTPVLEAIDQLNMQTILDSAEEMKRSTEDLIDALKDLPDSVESIKDLKAVMYELLHKMHAVSQKKKADEVPALNSFGNVIQRNK